MPTLPSRVGPSPFTLGAGVTEHCRATGPREFAKRADVIADVADDLLAWGGRSRGVAGAGLDHAAPFYRPATGVLRCGLGAVITGFLAFKRIQRLGMRAVRERIIEHYSRSWGAPLVDQRLVRGPAAEQIPYLSVLAFKPRQGRKLWTYATCGMSATESTPGIELHLFSPRDCLIHVETLTAIAHYHATGRSIRLGDTVNIGRPWMSKSLCDFGLISRPYLDGPKIENCATADGSAVAQCLWLIPITLAEREFKIQHGLDSLERTFEAANFNCADPLRTSVV